MDLFSASNEEQRRQEAPLAVRMRPRNLTEFIGQNELLGQDKLLRRAIEADRLTSLIFYGPPGVGKTTLAEIIAQTTSAHFERLNAVTAGIADLRRVIGEAEERYKLYLKKSILFIDEIHRFNKTQQDALLPAVEAGTIVMIGATTENPFYEVNTPLVSRSMIFHLQPLSEDSLHQVLINALTDQERGLGDFRVRLSESAMNYLVNQANGDARKALNILELAVLTTKPEIETGIRQITETVLAECLQQRIIPYDRQGEKHYDTISAFIKSIRGSDPDAAVYYLARMLTAGEDPKFIARRLVIHASEDVGNADPQALLVATAAAQAVEMIGLPEAQLSLAQATLYLATAPKSNASYIAIKQAMRAVQEFENQPVPGHLRDASHPKAAQFGAGVGYRYPHDYQNAYIKQDYLPENIRGQRYYYPTERGYERKIKDYLTQLESKKVD